MRATDELIETAAHAAAERTLARLKAAGRVKHHQADSFRKTEQVLRIYPKLPNEHPERARIEKALRVIDGDDYRDVIPSIYFDGMTVTELAEIYDCKYQNVSKRRNRLVRAIAAELFPEDVLREIKES